MIQPLFHTKLSTCASAIRQCWQSHDKGGCYPTPTDDIELSDVSLMERIILKHKHSSTAEHLVVTVNLSFGEIPYYPEMAFFISNPYSIVTSIDDFNYVITTNARVLIEHQDKLPVFISKVTPTSWQFLFEEQA